MTFAASWVALLTMLAGCIGEADAPREIAVDSPDTIAAPSAPAVYTDSISIEGMVEQIQVRDFEPPVGFPLGFRTTVPADMVVEYVTTGQGDGVRFEAAFAGSRRPDAALSFTVLPVRMDSAAARNRVAAIADSLGAIRRDATDGDWAVERYGFQGDTVGSVGLGVNRGRWFYFVVQYPPEFGDGMGPRVDLILRRWSWSADGTGLLPE